jgi:hypothetical protein
MGRNQLFEALPLPKYWQNRWLTICGEESLIVMPSSQHPSGRVLLATCGKPRLIRLKDSRYFGSSESSYDGNPRVAIAAAFPSNTRGGRPYSAVSHQVAKFLNRYSRIKHQVQKRVHDAF